MKQILLKHKVGNEVFLEKKVDCLYCFNKDESIFKSESFMNYLPLGNFVNVLLWKSLLIQSDTFYGFDMMFPLSRVQITKNLLKALQKNKVKKIKIEEEKLVRKYNYQNLFKYLIDEDFLNALSLSKLLKLSPFTFNDLSLEQEEISINVEEILLLSSSYQSLWESKFNYFKKNPLYFLPKNLQSPGLEKLNGFIYETSGYSSHLFYLPQIESTFIFKGDLKFIEAWFLFVQTLNEIEYFENEDYLNFLLKKMNIYPWSYIEVASSA